MWARSYGEKPENPQKPRVRNNMKESIQSTKTKALRRARRVRAKMCGTSVRPRMSLHVSSQHIAVQCIDDQTGVTLFSASDRLLENKMRVRHVTVSSAQEFGKKVSAGALAKGIKEVVFDRGSRAYHGRVKAFAEGAREGGLKF